MEKLGKPFSSIYPPKEQAASPWFAALSDREAQCLGYEMLRYQSKDGNIGCVDVGQTIGRGSVTPEGL
eukprot:4801248-Pyramimonas_sp.AAC.1